MIPVGVASGWGQMAAAARGVMAMDRPIRGRNPYRARVCQRVNAPRARGARIVLYALAVLVGLQCEVGRMQPLAAMQEAIDDSRSPSSSTAADH